MRTPIRSINPDTQAVLFGLSAVLLWSTVATAFKIGLQTTSVLMLLCGACFFSISILTLVLAIQKELYCALTSLWSYRYRSLTLGLLNPILYYLVLFEAFDRLPAQVAQPINYTWAIVFSILAVPFLGKKISRNEIYGLLIAYSGVVVISLSGAQITGSLDGIGITCAFVSTILWAGYWLINTKDTRPAVHALFQNFVVALPILLILVCINDASLLFSSQVPSLQELSPKAIVCMIYIGFFEMGISFVLWQLALQKTHRSARISSLIFLSPFISLFIIHHVLGEPLLLSTFLGLLLIVFGLAIGQIPRIKRPRR